MKHICPTTRIFLSVTTLLGQTVDDSGRTYPDLTSGFVFNPRRNIKLSQGTHPVIYVGAGSHASFPTGGRIRIYDKDILEEGIEVHESMSHTGLVLSTLADESHRGLWESYDLVVLPEPDPTNSSNMGLPDSMSWLGADVLWGTPFVKSPDSTIPVIGSKGNKSPRGPYHEGWEELKFFRQGFTGSGLDLLFIDTAHPFRYKDVPDSYHHWTIIGDETWSGTVSLSGDVVVFPGATLTMEAGTVVTFPSQSDRHQFREGDNSLSELFVYGTLKSEGTSTNQVVFRGPNLSDNARRWGGIRVMEGGSDILNHTEIRNMYPPTARPTDLTAQAGDGEATLRWGSPSPADPSITGWQYRTRPKGVTEWGSWKDVSPSTRTTREAMVPNLAHGVRHQFEIRAVNAAGGGPASNVASVALTSVAFSASRYSVIESGNPVELRGIRAQAEDPIQAGKKVLVEVRLTPAANRRLAIPVTVTAGPDTDEEDYRVDDLNSGAVRFGKGKTSQSFTIMARSDQDLNDEMVTLGFGELPAGVRTDDPATATLTIYDTPNQPTGLTAAGGHEEVTLSWDDPLNSGITGWQYQVRRVVRGVLWGDWMDMDRSRASTTSHTVMGLDNGVAYRFKVRAYNTRGIGVASEAVEATPSILRATAVQRGGGVELAGPGQCGHHRLAVPV